MAEIKDLSGTDANNTGTAANAGFPENMAYSDVNNAARALEGMIARHFADSNGTLTTTGSSNAYLLTPNRTVSAYTAGDAYMIKASFTNTGAVTVNVSSLGAKSIVKPSGDALAAGELTSGGIYAIIFDGTNFQLAGADDPENLTLTSLTVTGTTALNGNTTIGDAASDTVTITADVASDLIPSADGTHDLGAVGSEWQDLFIDGTANIDSLVADTADIDSGTIDGTVIGGSTAAAITGTTIVANTSVNIAGDGATVTGIKDEDDMASDSATKLATQQSIKAYVDNQITAQDLDVTDGTTSIDIDLDSESLGILGGTGIDSSASGTGVSLSIDSTVATLTDSQTLTNKTLTSPVLNTGVSGTAILDEDNMASNSATQLATQQSIKTYVDNQLTAEDLDFQADSGGALSVDLDSQTFTLTGGTGIDTVGANQTVTFAIDSTVTTLTGTQTLTNKTLTSPVLDTGVSGTAVLDEDNMASDSATKLATQQSIKAYVDSQVTAQDLDVTDGTTSIDIDLDSESLGILGGTGIDSTASGTGVTLAIDATVATLTGSQSLTNKTIDVDSNTVSNIEVDNLKSGVLDTDLTSVATGDTTLASAKAIKTYVDSQVTAQDLDVTDGTTSIDIDLDSESLGILGGTGIDSTASGTGVTLAIDSTVATLTGTQTLTNKSLTAPTLTGTAVVASLDISGDIDVDGTTNLDVVDIDGAVDFASTTAHAGNATFADNAKAIFGAGSDLEIYHTASGNHSIIEEVGGGNLVVRTNGPHIEFDKGSTEYMARMLVDGAVELYYDSALKLATSSTGIDITGSVTADGLTVDSGATNVATTFKSTDATVGIKLEDDTGNVELSALGNVFSVQPGGGSAIITATSTGVGIGLTSNISSKLHINSEMSFGPDGDNRAILGYASNAFTIGTRQSATNYFSTVTVTGGNVGIGIAPTSKFTINDSSALEQRIVHSGNGTTVIRRDGAVSYLLSESGVSSSRELAFGFQTSAGSSITETMRIDSSGNVGIGSSSVTGNLQILTATAGSVLNVNHNTAGSYPKASGIGLGATSTSLTVSSDGSTVSFMGGAGLYAENTAAVGNPTSLVFWTNLAGTPAEAMRIDASQNLIVGNTSSGAASAVTLRADGVIIAPEVYSTAVSASLRDLQIDSSGFLGYSTSTRDTKENIESLTDVSWLLDLDPVSFNRKITETEVSSEIEYGLVAEDVESVNANICFYDETENGKELVGITYSKLITPILKLVQEQQTLIESLTDRIAALENN